MAKKTTIPAKTTEPTAPSAASLLTQVRAAASLDEALAILQPDVRTRSNADTRYEIVETAVEPLPQKRGASVRVYAVAARINAPFKAADVQQQLPDLKSAAFWVRKLAALGFFRVAN